MPGPSCRSFRSRLYCEEFLSRPARSASRRRRWESRWCQARSINFRLASWAPPPHATDVGDSFRGANAKAHSPDVHRATASLRWSDGSFTDDDFPTADLFVDRPAPVRAPPLPPRPAFHAGPSLVHNGGRGAFALRCLERGEKIADYTVSTSVETKAARVPRPLPRPTRHPHRPDWQPLLHRDRPRRQPRRHDQPRPRPPPAPPTTTPGRRPGSPAPAPSESAPAPSSLAPRSCSPTAPIITFHEHSALGVSRRGRRFVVCASRSLCGAKKH